MRRRLHEAPLLLMGGGLLLFIVTLFLMGAAIARGGLVSPSPEPPPAASGGAAPATDTTCESTKTTWLAIASKHKKTADTFGDPVTSSQQTDVLNGMQAYAYKDPAGAAALTAVFDNATDKVNNRVENYVGDHKLWCQEVDRMMSTARNAGFSVTTVNANMWWLYMVKTGDSAIPVAVQQDQKSIAGTAVVFSLADRNVELLLDGHYQPVGESEFPNMPHVAAVPSPKPSATTSHEATTAPVAPTTPETNEPRSESTSSQPTAVPAPNSGPAPNPTPSCESTTSSSLPPREGGCLNGGNPGGF